MPKISIIVPVYNAEKYLHRCLDSIISQTFKDWECLVIDDGSTDTSWKICYEYSQKDNRIKIIHKNNSGVSSARNMGLSIANGEYVSFVDADDWIEPNMYYTLIMEGRNADVIICNIISEFDNYSKIIKTVPYNGNKAEFISNEIIFGWNSVCKMIIKRSIISKNNIEFKNFRYNEDYVFSLAIFCVAKSIIVLDRILYHYNRINGDSALHNMPTNIYIEIISAEEAAIRILKESRLYPFLKKEIAWRILRAKQDLILNPDTADLFLRIHPETHSYICSSPVIGLKMKIFMLLLVNNKRTVLNALLKMRSKRLFND